MPPPPSTASASRPPTRPTARRSASTTTLDGDAPDRLELLIRTPGSDGSLVVPVEPTRLERRVRVGHIGRPRRAEHAHHLPVARDRWRRGHAVDGGAVPIRRRSARARLAERPARRVHGALVRRRRGPGTALRRAERGGRGAGRAAARDRARRPGRRIRVPHPRGVLRRDRPRRARVDRRGRVPEPAHDLHVELGRGRVGGLPRDGDRPRDHPYRLPRRDRQPVP